MNDWLLGLHVLFSLYMFGLIWFVQVVHYPLMASVGVEDFVSYERRHTQLTGWVTAPMMLIELGTGLLLAFRADDQPLFWYVNLALILLLWASTFFVQVPLHQRLSQTYDPAAMRGLVRTNWARTVLWTVRAVGLVWWVIARS